MRCIWLAAAAAVALFSAPAHAQLAVVATDPPLNASVAKTHAISVEFDRPLSPSSIDGDSFRVFGRGSGPVTGSFSFSNGNRRVTLTPESPFSAGELVFVNLSHDVQAADASILRAAGYAFQFTIAARPSSGTFEQIDVFSNRSGPGNTRIYGAAATDLNGDGYLDLATINEVSADVRVFINRADGSGLYHAMLPREPIGLEASPNEPADFDNDGRMDLCTAAATGGVVNVLLGAGDGSFASNQEIHVGTQPHGIAPLDVDGDGDLDIVNANVGSGNLSLMLNDGHGVFGPPAFFDGGVIGEYGLTQADMNRDGITDLVVAGRDGNQIITQLGNGNGTFSAAGPPQPTGGSPWVVVVGDVNGDGDLDAVTANDGTGNIGVLIGNGDGTFQPVQTVGVGSHVPSVDLGDLDGDGDLDMVVSSFGGGFWRRFANDGAGHFTAVETIAAPDNPSCSILLDFDGDGDLDMALTDEIADVVILMQNDGAGGSVSGCSPGPETCREPTKAKAAKLQLVDRFPDDRDRLTFSWTKGEATTKADFGDPTTTEGYDLCVYEDGLLVQSHALPSAGTCGGVACWKDQRKGYSYRDKDLSPDGILTAKLTEGLVGKPSIKVTGKGQRLSLSGLLQLDGTLEVQLQKRSDDLCFGARFTPPFRRNDGATLSAVSDPPPPPPPAPLWSAIHAQVVQPASGGCVGCHGFSGGLSLVGCDAAHANLVNVASTEHLSMDRVEPGDAGASWLMHKLDGTHAWLSAQCAGMACGERMPLGGPYLSAATRDAIRTWIENGAVNDCP